MRLIVLLALTAALSAGYAQEAKTYDVRKLMTAESAVGEVYVESSSRVQTQKQVVTQDGKVLQNTAHKTTISYTRTVVIQARGEDGWPSKEVHTFTSWARVVGDAAAAPFKPVTVTLTRAADGSWGHDKAGELPADLAAWLDADLKGRVAQAGKPSRDEAMAPSKRLAVGATWNPKLEKIIASMPPLGGLKLDQQASTALGTLVSVTSVNGTSIAVIDLKLKLVIKQAAGLKLKQPTAMRFSGRYEVDVARPHAGKRSLTMAFKLVAKPDDAPEGVLLNMDLGERGVRTRALKAPPK